MDSQPDPRGKTAAKLTAVYRDCEQLLAGNPQGPLLLWRGGK